MTHPKASSYRKPLLPWETTASSGGRWHLQGSGAGAGTQGPEASAAHAAALSAPREPRPSGKGPSGFRPAGFAMGHQTKFAGPDAQQAAMLSVEARRGSLREAPGEAPGGPASNPRPGRPAGRLTGQDEAAGRREGAGDAAQAREGSSCAGGTRLGPGTVTRLQRTCAQAQGRGPRSRPVSPH